MDIVFQLAGCCLFATVFTLLISVKKEQEKAKKGEWLSKTPAILGYSTATYARGNEMGDSSACCHYLVV